MIIPDPESDEYSIIPDLKDLMTEGTLPDPEDRMTDGLLPGPGSDYRRIIT